MKKLDNDIDFSNNILIQELLKLKKYPSLYEPQKKAIKDGILETKDNYIVIAPTSTGKTLIAEIAIFDLLKSGGRAIYLVPSKVLVKEKLEEFDYLTEHFYVSDGKGERAWVNANLLILTFESFFFHTLRSPIHAKGFSLVIVDEFHLLYDSRRGCNLEKNLILLKEFDLRIICLSATFEDKNEVSRWLYARLITIPEKFRKIELKESVIPLYDFPQNKRLDEFFKYLLSYENEPYLIFCRTKQFSISRAEKLMKFLKKTNKQKYDTNEIQAKMRKKMSRNLTDNEKQLSHCLSFGIAFHNSLLDMEIRNLIEERFLDNQVNWLFTTTTLAYGFNSPAKSVVVQDTTLFDPSIMMMKPLPVYMYLQMIGRAGRPQYYEKGEKAGYVYVVANSLEDEYRIENTYFVKILEDAYSHLGHGDYGLKAILELIYARRNKYDDIIKFFELSFNNFQSQKNPLNTYDLEDSVKYAMTWLIDNGFIIDAGGYGYKLTTNLGQVVVSFMMQSFRDYPLDAFKEIEEYVSEKGLESSFDTIYKIIKALGIMLFKKARKKSEEIEEFFSNRNIYDIGNEEYTAYVIWNGWMQNKELNKIEEEYNVYADPIKYIAREISSGLQLMEEMYKRMKRKTSEDFKRFIVRVEKGVSEKQLSVAIYKGYGRILVKDLYKTALNIIAAEKGALRPEKELEYESLLDFYKEFLLKKGEDELEKRLIGFSEHFKKTRGKKFIGIVKNEIEN